MSSSILNIAHHIQCNFYTEDSGFKDITGDLNLNAMGYLGLTEKQLPVLAESASNLYSEASAILGL